MPNSATPGSKGLTSSVPIGTQTGFSANSNTRRHSSVENSRMGDEEQASSQNQDANGNNNRNVEVDTLGRSTVTGIGEQKHLDTEGSDIPIELIQLADVIEDVRSLLALSVSNIKSSNQSNGYLVGAGRKKSMKREPWEHLQYAADLLARPQANIYDLLEAIQCLLHSDPTYEVGRIPWDKIYEKYPPPASRKITPIIWPGPPDEDEHMEATAEEYGYTRVGEPVVPSAIEPTATQEPAVSAEVPEPALELSLRDRILAAIDGVPKTFTQISDLTGINCGDLSHAVYEMIDRSVVVKTVVDVRILVSRPVMVPPVVMAPESPAITHEAAGTQRNPGYDDDNDSPF